MARTKVPTIPDDKIDFFREMLYRQLSHLFKWEGLPQTVPHDYLERNLVRYGTMLYYENEEIGQDVLRATVMGYNRHDLPTTARTFTPNTVAEVTTVTRNIRRLADSENVVELFDPTKDGVLIQNMEYGQSCKDIVDFYAKRLTMAQQAIDTNMMWANVPYIFQVSTDDTRLSIEKMFQHIFEGVPFIISDKDLFTDNKDRTGVPSGIQLIVKELMDAFNEIMMKFKEAVGFNTAGVDKAERVNTMEISSNDQHTKSVIEIMLEQRKLAAEAINQFFGQSITVELLHEELPEGGMEDDEDGDDDFGTPSPDGDE